MTDNMPDNMYAGMTRSGATYWCRHSTKETAKIVGVKNAKGFDEVEYTRSDNHVVIPREELARMRSVIDTFSECNEWAEGRNDLIEELLKEY